MKHTSLEKPQGFTLVELLIVMGIALIILGMITFNLAGTQRSTSINASVNKIVADIDSQRLKSMSGTTVSPSASDSFGVSFQSNKYVLFHGTAFNSGDSSNYSVNLDNSVLVSSTFPGNVVVFSQASGEVANFASSSNTITINNTGGTEQKVLTINWLGVITNIQ